MAKKKETYPAELRGSIQARLNRIEGQVRGLARMLEEDRNCIEVLQQLASVQAAMRGVSKSILRNYVECCTADASCCATPQVYDELMEVIYKFAK